MLKPEEAKKRLDAVRNRAEWIRTGTTRLEKLSTPAVEAARLLVGTPEKRPRDGYRRDAATVKKLQALPDAQVLGIAVAVYPRLEPAIRAAWKLMDELPYATAQFEGAASIPFRTPGRPDLLAERRRQWVMTLLTVLEGFDQDVAWVAEWAGHLNAYGTGQQLGILLAGGLATGDAAAGQVGQTLRAAAAGTHDVAAFGSHVIHALLCSPSSQDWEYVGKMLLAAQRQEGLRQTILEACDVSQVGAFRYMMGLIREHDLARFAAVARAVDVWFGLLWDSSAQKEIEAAVELSTRFMDDNKARRSALSRDDEKQVYFALHATAVQDATSAVAAAEPLLRHRKSPVRFAAAHLLCLLQLEELTIDRLLPCLADDDPRIPARIIRYLSQLSTWAGYSWHPDPQWQVKVKARLDGAFDAVEALVKRLAPKAAAAKPVLFPWIKPAVQRSEVADLLAQIRSDRPAERLMPYVDMMSATGRAAMAEQIGRRGKLSGAGRDMMIRLMRDGSAQVRGAAVEACRKLTLDPAEATLLEGFLTRQAEDLRRGILSVLTGQPDTAALASAARLLAARDRNTRLAGLDLLREMSKAGRSVEQVRAQAKAYADGAAKPTRDEQQHLTAILSEPSAALTYDDALGLMDPSKVTPPAPPRDRKIAVGSAAAGAILEGLVTLIEKHKKEPISYKYYDGSIKQELLGTVTYEFPVATDYSGESPKPRLRSRDELPLADVWCDWWEKRPKSMRDDDGLELLRAQIRLELFEYRYSSDKGWFTTWCDRLGIAKPPARYQKVVSALVDWLAMLYPATVTDATRLDIAETALAALPLDEIAKKPKKNDIYGDDWRSEVRLSKFGISGSVPADGEEHAPHHRRTFNLLRYLDRPRAGMGRSRVPTEWIALAHTRGWVNDDDVFDHFLGPRELDRSQWSMPRVEELRTVSPRSFGELEKNSPRVAALFERCIERVLEIELARGEQETLVTPAAMSLGYAGGMKELLAVLSAMGRTKLRRGHFWGNTAGRAAVFSHLIRATLPRKDQSPADFARASSDAAVPPELLTAVGVYAPQWIKHVEASLKWPGFEEAVWWIHAHTKDTGWSVDQEIREQWNAQVRQRTALEQAELTDGAVDVAWFHRAYKELGPDRWDEVYELAKYAASGGGHRRAQIFADAMLGRLKVKPTIDQISQKRTPDMVRALGLIPLDRKSPDADVLKRYKVLQEFSRTSRQFGSQRQATEKRAAAIGQANLARTVGYPDPIRLQWAMETEAVADLAKGPVTVKVGEVAVALAIGDDGLPDISVDKAGKPLASVPAAVRKHPDVKELSERKTELRRSASRMRQSLELAMCRGDIFRGDELAKLLANPILRPMLERLVFVGEGILGYPVDKGRGLCGTDGKIEPVKKTESLRLAHPHDLLATKKWSQWQRDCFAAERVQPFKQIFRELYVPTGPEKQTSATRSERYAGQQVNPRQAMALLGGRGWVAAPEQGVFRTFHDEKITAWLEFQESFYTPAEVDGLTVEAVAFARRGDSERMSLTEVPPRLFSEVMRDVDLIVSVAHRGGVDPEASQSTVEMRAALLRETLQLLKLKNVELKGSSAIIKGQLAEYSVHLGSASAHLLPGGALFLVPVHSQHRGRLFLPFADDDPKSAEVLSKVMMLARDEEIRDVSLLEQIRARR